MIQNRVRWYAAFIISSLLIILLYLFMGFRIYFELHDLYEISHVAEGIKNSDNRLTHISEQLRRGVPHSRPQQQEWSEALRAYNDTLQYFFTITEKYSEISSIGKTLNEYRTIWASVYAQMVELERDMKHFNDLPDYEVLSIYIEREKETLPREKLYELARFDYKLYSHNIFVKELLHTYMSAVSKDVFKEIERRRNNLIVETLILIPAITLLFVLMLYLLFRYDREKRVITSRLGEMQRMENISRATGQISHDLKNMFAGIMGYVQISLLDKECSPKLKAHLENISDVANQAITLAKTIEHVSRKNDDNYEPVDLYTLLGKVKNLIAVILPKNIQLVVTLPEKHFYIEGNELHLYQVFMNLSINASHAIGEHGTITITAKIEKEFAYISVTDTGCGIEQENLHRIFEPGFSTKHKSLGSGYGLSIVYNIIEQHKGSISVESIREMGTTFTIKLPIDSSKA